MGDSTIAQRLAQSSPTRKPGERKPHRQLAKKRGTSGKHRKANSQTQKPFKSAAGAWIIKILGVLSGLVFGIIAICYTYLSWEDARCSRILDEWQAEKDFLEYCSLDENTKIRACQTTKTKDLDPPPKCYRKSSEARVFQGKKFNDISLAAFQHASIERSSSTQDVSATQVVKSPQLKPPVIGTNSSSPTVNRKHSSESGFKTSIKTRDGAPLSSFSRSLALNSIPFVPRYSLTTKASIPLNPQPVVTTLYPQTPISVDGHISTFSGAPKGVPTSSPLLLDPCAGAADRDKCLDRRVLLRTGEFFYKRDCRGLKCHITSWLDGLLEPRVPLRVPPRVPLNTDGLFKRPHPGISFHSLFLTALAITYAAMIFYVLRFIVKIVKAMMSQITDKVD